METQGSIRNQPQWPFWTVVILSLPTFAAFLIVLSAMVRPNVGVYLLIPLMFVAPVGLIIAIGIAVARLFLHHQLSRATWIVLVLGVFAAMAAIGLLRQAGVTGLH